VFSESSSSQSSPSRGPLVAGAAILLVLLGVAWFFFPDARDEPAGELTVRDERQTAPAATTDEVAAREPAPEVPRPRLGRDEPRPVPAPTPAPAPALATLRVDSDVPGASVFLDREYVGETPLTVRNLTPGSRRLNLAAEGFESVSRDITLEPGEQTVAMRFREVRLNERLAVVHRHGIGSCEGQLLATLDGLRYETAHRSDSFALGYDQIETFEVHYLDRTLRVKQRGGRTWNFTQPDAETADALFVFHRDVMAARDKLAKGFAPVT
jgi:hypothetical protein